MEPKGGTKPTDSPHDGVPKEVSEGYDCEFVASSPSAFQVECPVCRLVLQDPYQATCCGTSYCYSCIQRILAGNNCCPVCRQDNFSTFSDKRLKRALAQLHVFCTHREGGCTWKGKLGELKHHLTDIHTSKSFHCECDRAQWMVFPPVGKGCKDG